MDKAGTKMNIDKTLLSYKFNQDWHLNTQEEKNRIEVNILDGI